MKRSSVSIIQPVNNNNSDSDTSKEEDCKNVNNNNMNKVTRVSPGYRECFEYYRRSDIFSTAALSCTVNIQAF